MQSLCIRHFLDAWAERTPDAIAIAAPGRPPLTYGGLLAHIGATVKKLNDMGLGRNDRVAIALPDGLEMAAAFLAVAAGATSAPLNPAYRANEFAFYLSDLRAKALIVQLGFDSPARAAAQTLGIPIIELIPMPEEATGVFTLRREGSVCPVHTGFAKPDDVALVLHTSGTTARPKLVPLTQRNLCASAHNIRASLNLDERDRCLNVMPLFHIHGLIGAVLSSLMSGGSVVCTPGFYAPRFFPWLEEFGPTWYTAVPTMHQAILARAAAHRDGIARSPLRFIRSSSAPLPSQVTAQLESVFNVPVIDSYGMTEACHQIASNPLPPRARKAGSVGVGAGTEIAVMDEAGRLLPSGETGEVVIRGANVTPGYENGSAANQSAFANGWFKTGDQGFLDCDGYLFLTGRLKEVINRGGEKISPREVDEVLMDHPAVAQAVTFAVPDDKLGEEAAAAVVLREGTSTTDMELREFAARRLTDFKVPSQILILSEIPKGPTGKVQRVGLAEKLGVKSSSQLQSAIKTQYTAPRTLLEETLVRIWAEVLGLERVGIHDNFLDLGGDSILATLIVSRVRQTLSVEMSLVSLFEKPTVAEIAGAIETSSPVAPGSVSLPLQSVARDGEIPLSYGQERMWFADQLEPGNPTYNRPAFMRLTGRLNVTALERCLNELVGRHEVLRTSFPAVDGRPFQVISPPQPLTLSLTDISGLTEGEREDEARRQAIDEASRPFDLTHGPLVHARLLRLRKYEHLLFLTTHHVVFDGWSMEILVRELSALYEAFSTGSSSPLPELPAQYADYAVWQRNWFKGEVLDSQLGYWKKQLAGASPVLELPADRPRPALRTHRGARQSLRLSQKLTEALKELSRREEVTLFVTLLAAFKTLLYRYTGQEDIVVGSPIAGRTRQEIENLIGLFINMLILRTDLSGNPTFRQLLGRVREMALGAYAHQDLPFERLVEELKPERSLSHTPLFQVMMQLRNIPQKPVEPAGLKIEDFEFDTGLAKFELTLEMVEQGGGMVCLFEYNTDLFDDSTITRMVGHFETLLESIVADPGRRLSELPVLTDVERQQLLVEWNDTKKDYPKDQCIHQLFEAQVERTPDAVAVVFPSTGSGHSEDKQLTYRQLNCRVNQLARYLRTLDVGPDIAVGICTERSLEMVVGLLGILKAGGAYVPLDPDYPTERLAFMLEDIQASVLLTQRHLIKSLPESEAQVICLDADWEVAAEQDEENLSVRMTPENLAYVIFTSGSTGTPKGAMNTHRGICNRLLWMQDAYQLTELDRVLQKTPFSFDVSVWEFFWPLLTGARLVIARPGGHQDGAYLVKLISEQEISTLHFVPSMLQIFLDQKQGLEACSSLRRVICSGEALPVELEQRFFARLDAELHNLYGPTEAAIDVTFWACKRDHKGRSVPMGCPIANTQIYLLDSHLRPVPVGVEGELYIGGVGLARGYLNRPDLTAEKFIPNPFSDEPGARLYKTGDLARYLPHGDIEFLGRIDNQVKIRGFRIELGEIEAVLSRHPAVREVVITTREDSPGDKRLVAYVVPNQGLFPTVTELRSYLKEKLPDHMIPAAFVMLETLPLTPNGKINRRALPVPNQARPDLEAAFVAPRTLAEEVLERIWAEVLGLERVGAHDNFLDLGGHSLLAAQIISRVRETLDIDLPFRMFFEAPTIAQLAACIEAAREEMRNLTSSPIVPLPSEKEFPLSFSQQRFWFLSQLDADSFVYNNTYGFRLTGPLNVEALEETLGEIVRRHEALRTTFCVRDGEPFQVVAEQSSVKLPLIDLTGVPAADRDAEAQRLLDDEFRRPFDLSSDLMLRATLVRLDDNEHALFLTIHHIAFDHWSIEVLYRELSVIYKALSTGNFSPLPELPIQYKDYAIWQRRALQGATLENHLAYWRRQLSNSPPVLQLPTDYARPAVHTSHGARQSLTLPKTLVDALKTLSREEGVSFFMTLLAAFKILLQRLTGQDDIVVGSPVAGRDRSETEALIGVFLNSVALRTNLSGNPSFRELLTRVREVALGAYDHRELPLERLLEELPPKRDPSRTLLFQVFFNMYNFEDTPLQLHGLKVTRLETSERVSRYDLTLYVREHDNATHLRVVYNTDLFEAPTIKRMLGHLRTLLEGLAANPDRRLSDLPILTEAERRQLVVEWNDTKRDYRKDQRIHQLFEAQAERTPDAVAVIFEEQQLTYRELNRRANQLAHYLRKLGVGPEVFVGLCVERSLEMVVGILGVLKAGGAYVFLDPSYPKERLAFLMEDTGSRLILTRKHLLENLPESAGELICLDRDRGLFAVEKESNPQSLGAEHLAYVAYTSGSTGKPKGILSHHPGVVNYLSYLRETYHLDHTDSVLQIPSLSFDASVRDLLGPLTVGAKVIIIKDTDVKDPAALLSKIREHRVSCLLSVVPTMLNGLVDVPYDKDSPYDSVRLILVSGEALQLSAHRKAKEVFGQRVLVVNQYGPTECTMTSTYWPVHAPPCDHEIALIGKPIPNAQIYIVDGNLNLVPIGAAGELCIGGDGLAWGYLNRPDLTAETFVPNPFSDRPGARLYGTGDRARYLSDGNIEFLGRIDHQVKIRGFRIEPGEIEAVLRQHAAVRKTVVVAREDGPNNNRLVAYVVHKENQSPAASELRNFLRQKLPDYMIPSAFVFLDALPLTPNGKVDRKALPPPDGRPELEEAFVAPRTSVEEALAGIWTEVLKLERVGIHDNFFRLGGHSLLATKVGSRVRNAFQVALPLPTLFEKPTVAELAEVIEETIVDELEKLTEDEAKQFLKGRALKSAQTTGG